MTTPVKDELPLQRRLAMLTLQNAFSIITNPQHAMYNVFRDQEALNDLADAIQIHENDEDPLAETKIGQLITGQAQNLHLWEKPGHIDADEPEALCIIHYVDKRGWRQYHVYDYKCRCEQCTLYDKNESVGELAVDLAYKIRCGWDLEGLEDEIQDIREHIEQPVKKNMYVKVGSWLLTGICSHPYGMHVINQLRKILT